MRVLCKRINYFGVNGSCSIALRINLNHYVKLMFSYFYGVNAIGDIDNFLICMIIINRVYIQYSHHSIYAT